MLLVGKNAVITGCLQGIGRATLETFAREGANVFACCQAENAAFNEYLIDLSEKYRVDIIPVYFDFLDENEIKKVLPLFRKVKNQLMCW